MARDFLILIHVSSAFLTLGFPIIVFCEAIMLRNEVAINVLTIRRFNFFKKKSNILGRVTYLMPITGTALIAVSQLQSDLIWLYIAVACWVVSALILELILFKNWTSIAKFINDYSQEFLEVANQTTPFGSNLYAKSNLSESNLSESNLGDRVKLKRESLSQDSLNALKLKINLIIVATIVETGLLFTVLYLMVRQP
jgi:hypothetical protein